MGTNSKNNWPAWPHYEEDQIQAVVRALSTGKVNYWNGQEGRTFEREFAEHAGAKFGIAMSNGSVSLDLLLETLGVGQGDEVIVTPRSFVASVSCVVRSGATPIFADVDRVTQNITAETIAKVVTSKTKAIIPVHLAGWPCDMHAINELADAKSIYVIEDCAQAHSAKIGGQTVGSFGIAGSFSFCTDKIMTTGGEGGIVTLNDETLYEKLWSLKDHGKNRKQSKEPGLPGMFKFMVAGIGSNYRMSEMQAAIARIQLTKLDDWCRTRRSYAERLNAAFANVPGLRTTIPNADIEHAYYKYYVFVEQEYLQSGWSRERILAEILDRGIPCGSGSCSEIYNEQAFQERNLAPKEPLPVAAELGATSIMFQVHPTLKSENIDRTIEVVSEVMALATQASKSA